MKEPERSRISPTSDLPLPHPLPYIVPMPMPPYPFPTSCSGTIQTQAWNFQSTAEAISASLTLPVPIQTSAGMAHIDHFRAPFKRSNLKKSNDKHSFPPVCSRLKRSSSNIKTAQGQQSPESAPSPSPAYTPQIIDVIQIIDYNASFKKKSNTTNSNSNKKFIRTLAELVTTKSCGDTGQKSIHVTAAYCCNNIGN